jgi:uncharacterized protein
VRIQGIAAGAGLGVRSNVVEADRVPSRYVLSGSANPSLIRGASESLAGRIGILQLGPLTAAEQSLFPPSPFLEILLRMAAARQRQCLNLADFARDMAIAPRTASAYLDALEGTFLWRRLPPYLANIGKRLVKSPKASLADSGLLHHLLRVDDWETLDTHPILGPSWESWVVEQLICQTELLEPAPTAYYWRTQAGAEVDLVLETQGGRLIPIEIKHATRVNPSTIRGLKRFLTDFSERAAYGVVLYRGQTAGRIAENILLIPVESAVL